MQTNQVETILTNFPTIQTKQLELVKITQSRPTGYTLHSLLKYWTPRCWDLFLSSIAIGTNFCILSPDSYRDAIRSLKNRFVYRIANPHSIKGGNRNKSHPRATPIF